ncbi:hypothetical protein HMSSN036_07970 [Paenibacillus macerans]|nr:hypothetical protein HMSSN036_07970 [Paenibacillus macerans]
MFGTIPRNITITLKILCSIGLACTGGLAQPGEAAGYAAALALGAASEPAAGLQTAVNAPEQLRILPRTRYGSWRKPNRSAPGLGQNP